MRKRLLTMVVCLTVILLINWGIPFAAEKTSIPHPVAEHLVTEETHEEIHGEPHAVAPVPKVYYFYWVVLLLTLLSVVSYFYRIHRELPKHETLLLAGLLVVLGLVLYFIEQVPSLAGYFDTEKKKFVEGYHEPIVMSFLRFIYKIVLGILFVVYAFLGIHEEHKL